ncbi:hypothetical protein F4861DRAFT_4628 [Xylaria intraflava]|nr:hypothetical protein F4861DRAFT_4628 [Xylaria intraflava]
MGNAFELVICCRYINVWLFYFLSPAVIVYSATEVPFLGLLTFYLWIGDLSDYRIHASRFRAEALTGGLFIHMIHVSFFFSGTDWIYLWV